MVTFSFSLVHFSNLERTSGVYLFNLTNCSPLYFSVYQLRNETVSVGIIPPNLSILMSSCCLWALLELLTLCSLFCLSPLFGNLFFNHSQFYIKIHTGFKTIITYLFNLMFKWIKLLHSVMHFFNQHVFIEVLPCCAELWCYAMV